MSEILIIIALVIAVYVFLRVMVRALTRGRGNGWVGNGTINYQQFDNEVYRNETIGSRFSNFAKGWRAKKARHAMPSQYDEIASARKLVKGIALVNPVVVYSKGQHDGEKDEHFQLLCDMLDALGITIKTVDVSGDPTMHLGLPQLNGEPMLPYVFIDGLRIGDARATLDMLKSGELFDRFDRGNINYNETVAKELRRA